MRFYHTFTNEFNNEMFKYRMDYLPFYDTYQIGIAIHVDPYFWLRDSLLPRPHHFKNAILARTLAHRHISLLRKLP